MSWTHRKMTSFVPVHMTVEAQHDGVLMILKTKLKSDEFLLKYDGVTKIKSPESNEVKVYF